MPPDLNDLGQKLDEIAEKKRVHELAERARMKDGANMGAGMRAGVELVAPMIAGGLIGWGLDKWLGTTPVFLIIMLLLGVTTGFVNVWRATQNIGSAVGYSQLHKDGKNAKSSAKEEDSE